MVEALLFFCACILLLTLSIFTRRRCGCNDALTLAIAFFVDWAWSKPLIFGLGWDAARLAALRDELDGASGVGAQEPDNPWSCAAMRYQGDLLERTSTSFLAHSVSSGMITRRCSTPASASI